MRSHPLRKARAARQEAAPHESTTARTKDHASTCEAQGLQALPSGAVPVRWDVGGLDMLCQVFPPHPALTPVALLQDLDFKNLLERTGGILLYADAKGEMGVPIEVAETLRLILRKSGVLDDPAFQAEAERVACSMVPVRDLDTLGRSCQGRAIEGLFRGAAKHAPEVLEQYFPVGCKPPLVKAFVAVNWPADSGDPLSPAALAALEDLSERLEDLPAFVFGVLTLATMATRITPGEEVDIQFPVFWQGLGGPVLVDVKLRHGLETGLRPDEVDGRSSFVLGLLFGALVRYLEAGVGGGH